MLNKCNSSLIYLSVLIVLCACEYERIAAPEAECEAETLSLVIQSVQNTACNESTGEVTVEVEGEGAFEYSFNGSEFSESNVFTDLSAGTYTIQARIVDSNCLSEEVEATVNNEDGLQISLVEKSDSNCGENSGSILIGQEGGEEPIEYVLNGNQTQNDPEFTGLATGSYTILARDAKGCEAEITGVEIESNISFVTDIKPIIATNCAVNGCHNGSQPPDFSEDANILQNASRIKSRTGSGTMPPAGRTDLTAAEIEAIACWVDGGALDN